MNIKEKLNMDIDGLIEHGPINIVAFGDSVTHGALNNYNDYENVYWNVLKKKINAVRDSIPVNVINAGIGGATAMASLERLQRDVLSHHPDIVIVCFGLNDIRGELCDYINSLKIIFTECAASGADVIFMTPNMTNTYLAEGTEERWIEAAKRCALYQTNGRVDEYFNAATQLAKSMNIKVCDCYGEWKKLAASGVDTTQLLANKINHPTSEMHGLFADMLFDLIMGTDEFIPADYANTMYRG